MNSLLFLLIFLLTYIFIFGAFPRVLLIFTSMLLTYHREESIIERFEKLLPVYIFFIFIIGSLFSPLFGIVESKLKEIFFNMSPLFLAALFSFFFVWSIRIITLTNKSNFICFIFLIYKKKIRRVFKRFNMNHKNWKTLKRYLASFLFSLIFTTLLMSITHFLINKVFYYTKDTVYQYSTSFTWGKLGSGILVFLGFLVIILILILAGELLIKYSNIHEECYTD